MMKTLVFALILMSGVFAQCSNPDSVTPFELERYQGLWYEIARSPGVTATFQQNCECVTAEYSIQQDDSGEFVQVLNTCFNTQLQSIFTIEGRATQDDPEGAPASLTVGFPAVPGAPGGAPSFNYNVVLLEQDNYEYAVVYTCETSPFGELQLQWLLAREPRPDQALIDSILAEAEGITGFPAEQMGQFSQREDCPRRSDETSCGEIIAPSVIDIIVASPNHKYLERLVIELGLAGAELDDVTVFAPDDDAFRALFKELRIPTFRFIPIKWQVKLAIRKLGEEFLTETVLNHIVSATTCAAVILGENPTPDDPLELAAPLAGTEVFAYVDGDGVFVRTDCVVAEIDTGAIDLSADNGVVHSIKDVLAPGDQEAYCPDEVTEPCYPSDSATESITEIVVASEVHTILEAIVIELGLAEILGRPGLDATVFAPVDQAFLDVLEIAGVGSLEELIAAVGREFLTEVVLSHVVPSPVCAEDIIAAGPTKENPLEVAALSGAPLKIYLEGETVVIKSFCNTVRVSLANLVANNGVIHVVDAVIFQENDVYCPMRPGACSEKIYGDSAYDVVANSRHHRILKAVVDALGLADALKGNTEYTLFAPNDWAFWKLFWRLRVPRGSLESRLAWLVENVPGGADTLTTVVLNHLISGIACSETVRGSGATRDEPLQIEPADGTTLSIYNGRWHKIYVDTDCTRSVVNAEDLSYRTEDGTEGVVHSINNVIFPGGQDIFCPRA